MMSHCADGRIIQGRRHFFGGWLGFRLGDRLGFWCLGAGRRACVNRRLLLNRRPGSGCLRRGLLELRNHLSRIRIRINRRTIGPGVNADITRRLRPLDKRAGRRGRFFPTGGTGSRRRGSRRQPHRTTPVTTWRTSPGRPVGGSVGRRTRTTTKQATKQTRQQVRQPWQTRCTARTAIGIPIERGTVAGRGVDRLSGHTLRGGIAVTTGWWTPVTRPVVSVTITTGRLVGAGHGSRKENRSARGPRRHRPWPSTMTGPGPARLPVAPFVEFVQLHSSHSSISYRFILGSGVLSTWDTAGCTRKHRNRSHRHNRTVILPTSCCTGARRAVSTGGPNRPSVPRQFAESGPTDDSRRDRLVRIAPTLGLILPSQRTGPATVSTGFQRGECVAD